jgi:SOS-response transcriptional repressor LexA
LKGGLPTGGSVAIGRRLRRIRKERKESQGEFAQALGGCSQGLVSAIEVGKVAPSVLFLSALEHLNYSASWLLTGQEPMKSTKSIPSTSDSSDPSAPTDLSASLVSDRLSEWVRLPILGRISAGYPGRPPDEGTIDGHFPLPRDMISDPDAFCLRVNSDSMTGIVENGDLVVVSPALSSSIKDNDLVAVRLKDGDVLLKQFRRAGARAVLSSSNHSCPPMILDTLPSAAIIGKVLYTIHHYR